MEHPVSQINVLKYPPIVANTKRAFRIGLERQSEVGANQPERDGRIPNGVMEINALVWVLGRKKWQLPERYSGQL